METLSGQGGGGGGGPEARATDANAGPAWFPSHPQGLCRASVHFENSAAPSLRGGNTNPGHIETFYGEVDDVLAAADYVASLDYVDPARIYLGGHSTGGTLALLVAAAAPEGRFRAVFALGAVEDVTGYGPDVLPFDLSNPKEGRLRAPQNWLADIHCPTLVFEGTKQPGNFSSLQALQKRSHNPQIQFIPVPDGTHFSIIAPMVEKLSRHILADTPGTPKQP